MKVLMATDGSKHATAALTAAGRMLAETGRDVELLAVAPVVRLGPGGEQDRVCRRAKRAVERTQAALKDAGIDVRTGVKLGSPARVIVAASFHYDLTVVAAASHRAGSMNGLGPVASRLAEHAGGSALLARESTNTAGPRILVAVDGSEGSIRALDKLVELIDLSVADVTLLHVSETPWLHAGPDQEWLGFQEEEEEAIDPQAQMEREFVREADEILANARERLPARTAVNTLVYEGLPTGEILSEADRGDYDLVVIGATGARDLKHRILGSVSSAVAWNAPCSVLLVRGADWQ